MTGCAPGTIRGQHPSYRVFSRRDCFARTAVDSLPRARLVGEDMKELLPEPGYDASVRGSTAKFSRTPDSVTY